MLSIDTVGANRCVCKRVWGEEKKSIETLFNFVAASILIFCLYSQKARNNHIISPMSVSGLKNPSTCVKTISYNLRSASGMKYRSYFNNLLKPCIYRCNREYSGKKFSLIFAMYILSQTCYLNAVGSTYCSVVLGSFEPFQV